MKAKQTQLFYMKTQHTFYTAVKQWLTLFADYYNSELTD